MKAWFREFVYGFMMHNLDAVIECKANFPSALAVMTSNEILGTLVRGRVGIRGETSSDFEEFSKLMPHCYRNLDAPCGPKVQSSTTPLGMASPAHTPSRGQESFPGTPKTRRLAGAPGGCHTSPRIPSRCVSVPGMELEGSYNGTNETPS